MTNEEWNRIQKVVRSFRPSGITPDNFESLPNSVTTLPEPATARQINYLKYLRYEGPTSNLTKHDACRLIAGLVKEAR